MALVLVTGATGAPGITCTALGLALSWPQDVLLADCDRDPDQAVAAGYLRGATLAGRGLVSIIRAHREGRAIEGELVHHSLTLTAKESPGRRFLPGFSHPMAVELFEPVWPALADALAAMDPTGVDAVVDAGRISSRGLPGALLSRADLIVVVVRSQLRSLAALRLYLPILLEQIEALPSPPGLGIALVDPNHPYSAAEISPELGVPCWAEFPLDARAAGVLSDGDPEPRGRWHSALLAQYRATALRLRQRLDHERELDRQLHEGMGLHA
ncbi:MAG: hypothetical protein ACK5KO_02925 [Arachnia sp.]